MTDAPTTADPTVPIITSVVRFALVAGGGWAAKQGLITSDQSTMVVGSAAALAGLIWSIWQKLHANAKLKAAIAAPAVTPS